MSKNDNPAIVDPISVPGGGADVIHLLGATEEMVRRTYVARLGECDIVPFAEMRLPSANWETVRVGSVSRLVYEKRENTLENLLNVYAAVGSAGYGVVVAIKSGKGAVELHIGVRTDEPNRLPAESGEKLLNQAFRGNLNGSDYRLLSNDEVFPYEKKGTESSSLLDFDRYGRTHDTWAVSALTGIPSLKSDEREAFTQGLERFIDAMQGKEYTAILLADPVMPHRSREIERGYELLGSALSGLVKQQVSVGANENVTMSRTDSEGVTRTINESMALSQSHTEGTSWSHTEGKSESKTRSPAAALGAIGGAVGLIAGPPGSAVGATIGATIGAVLGSAIGSKTKGTSTSETSGGNKSETSGLTISQGLSDSKNINISVGATNGTGTSISVNIETQNRSAARIVEKIDQQLKRIDEARAYGMWNAACYFLCDSRESAQTAASLFSGCMRGEESGVEDSAVLVWSKPRESAPAARKEARAMILEYLQNLHHPRLLLSSNPAVPRVSPSALLTGRELALLMHLPRRSVGGVTVIETTGYGRDVHRLNIADSDDTGPTKHVGKAETSPKRKTVTLGPIRHLFRDQSTNVSLDLDNLVYHTLVTGTTGVGKTTGIKTLLKQCHGHGVKFLVIEPAKNEYVELLRLASSDAPVRRFQAGRRGDDCLRLNPLVFPAGEAVSLVEHIDRVCTLFNAAFPMYAAMPQLLEEAIVQSYERKGWDTLTSQCRNKARRFPTLREVAELVPTIVERAGYRQEAQSTYVGALTTRLRSLMRGVLGFTFMAQEGEETPAGALFDESCIVNVSSVGSAEKRAVMMGLLMIRLQEHRATQGTHRVDRLKHLMVLEEAHNILKCSSPNENMESSNPQGQAVAYFANALAEMRAFGQGFVIVDQSASSLDSAVLKNTNTKIVFRAPFEADRNVLGGSLALDERQTKVLAALENHTAVVKQNDWLEAVCCHLRKIDIALPVEDRGVPPHVSKSTPSSDKGCLVAVLSGLFAGSITIPRSPNAQSDEDTLSRWLEQNVKVEAYRTQIAEQLQVRARRELREIRSLLLAINPLERMLRSAEACAASEQGVLNHLLLMLREETGIPDDHTLILLAQHCLRCDERQGLLDRTARMIESNFDLGEQL